MSSKSEFQEKSNNFINLLVLKDIRKSELISSD